MAPLISDSIASEHSLSSFSASSSTSASASNTSATAPCTSSDSPQQQPQQPIMMNTPLHQQQEQRQEPPRPRVSRNLSRTQWWQKSVVKRNASSVQARVEQAMESSTFLQQPQPSTTATHALLDRSELILAARPLGAGAFSVVTEVVGVRLDPTVSASLTATQLAARQHLAETCLDPATGRGRFVVKHLQPDLLTRKSEYTTAAVDLAMEAAYLERLQHDHIIQLRALPVNGLSALSSGQHDGYFLLLDRLDATLQDLLDEWARQEQQVGDSTETDIELLETKVDYAMQLASACDYLHQHGLIFRDLKPQNVGFSADGRLQLFDFGLCRQLPTTNPRSNAVYCMSGVGTRRYMATEVINSGQYNCKADVYSWSMVIWQLFSLTKPYAEYCLHQHRIHVCQQGERPAALVDIATDHFRFYQQLDTLLENCWCESISDRLSMTEILEHLPAVADALNPVVEPLSPRTTIIDNVVMPLSPTVTTIVPTDDGVEAVVLETPPPAMLSAAAAVAAAAYCTLSRRNTDATRIMGCDDDESSDDSSCSWLQEQSRQQKSLLSNPPAFLALPLLDHSDNSDKGLLVLSIDCEDNNNNNTASPAPSMPLRRPVQQAVTV